MKLKKLLFITVGVVGLALGALGAVIPMIPSFPFLCLAAFGFAKSSEKLHSWFISTKLYKTNLESYIQGKGMTLATKIRIMATVTALMGFGFTMMLLKGLYIPCNVLFCIWVFHILYFIFGIKNCEEKRAAPDTKLSTENS